jgi:type I restriction enzyme S subunit
MEHPVEPADQLLKRILAERRAKWEAEELAKVKVKGIKPKDDSWKKKYKEPAGPDTANLPELPEGWVWATLESISDVIDPNPSHRMPKYVPKGVPLISSENFVSPVEIDFTKGKQVADETLLEQRSRYRIEFGDFAFSRIGTIGKTMFLPIDKDYCLSHALVLIKAIGVELSREYLKTVLSSDALLMQAREGIQSVGVPDLGMAKMRSFQIPLPSVKEQNAIVAEVDSHVSVIEELETTTRANLKRAERLRQTILQNAFSDVLLEP